MIGPNNPDDMSSSSFMTEAEFVELYPDEDFVPFEDKIGGTSVE